MGVGTGSAGYGSDGNSGTGGSDGNPGSQTTPAGGVTDGFGGAGGLLVGALSGGAGALGGGGGGAAAGPAIFVNLGTLTTVNCTATGLAATGGIGGGTAGNGGSDATAVFNYNGIVNSSATPGPVNGAVAAKTDLWARLAQDCDAMSRFVVSALIGLRNEQIGDAVGGGDEALGGTGACVGVIEPGCARLGIDHRVVRVTKARSSLIARVGSHTADRPHGSRDGFQVSSTTGA